MAKKKSENISEFLSQDEEVESNSDFSDEDFVPENEYEETVKVEDDVVEIQPRFSPETIVRRKIRNN